MAITVPGFPNFFMLNGPNSPVGNFSLIEVAELQMGYVLQLAEALRAGRCDEVSPSQDAMAPSTPSGGGPRRPSGTAAARLVPGSRRTADGLAVHRDRLCDECGGPGSTTSTCDGTNETEP
jgi:hypothetical protein